MISYIDNMVNAGYTCYSRILFQIFQKNSHCSAESKAKLEAINQLLLDFFSVNESEKHFNSSTSLYSITSQCPNNINIYSDQTSAVWHQVFNDAEIAEEFLSASREAAWDQIEKCNDTALREISQVFVYTTSLVVGMNVAAKGCYDIYQALNTNERLLGIAELATGLLMSAFSVKTSKISPCFSCHYLVSICLAASACGLGVYLNRLTFAAMPLPAVMLPPPVRSVNPTA